MGFGADGEGDGRLEEMSGFALALAKARDVLKALKGYLIGVEEVGKTMVFGTARGSVVLGLRRATSLMMVMCFFFLVKGMSSRLMSTVLGFAGVISVDRRSKTIVLQEETMFEVKMR